MDGSMEFGIGLMKEEERGMKKEEVVRIGRGCFNGAG
jgi:hypothetical protein